MPCAAPLGKVGSAGTPSLNSLDSAGRLKTTQWVNVPRGASGSSQIRARLRVPAGAFCHWSGGETLRASPVYCSGIVAPSWKAVLVNSSAIGSPPDGPERVRLGD